MFRESARRLGALTVSAVAALVLSACGSEGGATDEQALVFAAVPSEESTSLQTKYEPIIAMLEKETGRKITFQNATDYAAVIEGQRAGKIHFAQYGPFSYVLAKNAGVDATPLGAFVEAPGDDPGYQSYAITKAGSSVTSLADVRGKSVCFVDPASTSGYLYPTAGLLAAGVDPKKDITAVIAGGHDASVLAVMSGQCEVGFAYDTMVDELLISKGQLAEGDVTVLWKSEVIPGSPLAVSGDLEPALLATITKAIHEKGNVDYLLANGFCSDPCDIGEEGRWGYTPVDDALYDGVRKVCETTKDEKCQ
ncbi:phosphate starvation-inducible protein PhoH [Nocardia mangyaensis]|uniref:Phosphate starvation-inducible protein PhoH n=1 Tax=Nocardia mangyaensis TaxID=2213200 RepID=A0A1J0VND7_9NOCA|nr:phosphate/phosphite/phosphonate ABC transporter substrate-binding protein [Nocardia mangyaensis]APE33556.1 phosphate starvation-inducible protein PhoH [Nocardia mangyaensis]